ncbi:uncharacterized protein LOC124688770 [Lolium rigidum]|uniref:uncharacterized protein LOC124688770 n=1 Tax=Lolium rigidum TaxID=89674 RepID=UPI001F5CC6EB|nr:uncharacterized protein LOC124688770 [Lolium rigidum]
MKGAHPQDRKQKNKKQDLQVIAPYPGCLGRVINMFDLSNGVVATKMLTEKAHRDVSPAGKDRSGGYKMPTNQFPAQLEDKQRDSQQRKTSPTKRSSSPTNRSGVAPVKMLMEQDMWRQGVPEDEPLNVVARLMGLNDAPVQQSDLVPGRKPSKEYQSGAFGEIFGRNVKPKKESRCYQNQRAGTRHEQIWGGLGDQPSKISNSNSRHQGNEPSCDKRMSLVREKFAEAKRLATDEKLLHSKEFQEALQFLSSNKDMFLKFLDEPSPLLSNNHYGFEPVTPPSEVKQITILKPSESMKRRGNAHVGRQLYSDGNESESNRCRHQYQSLSATPANLNLSEPTRIVVLKPGPAKSHEDIMIPVSPLASSTEPDSEDDSVMAVDEIVSSRRLAKEITWQMRMRLKDSQDEDTSVSYEYHDTFIEDGSFSKSEVEIAKEVCGEISEDLEFGTPTSGRSWEFLSRSESPYSASCSSQASNRREPSVVKEAKRRILERWSVVSSTVSCEEERGARRSTGTLGEMLTIPEGKKDQEEFGGITIESTSPELDTEDPFSCLPRSRSLPLSLSYGGREWNRADVGSQQATNGKSRKPSSFREKVSSLFSKNKKPAREKLDLSGTSSGNDTLASGSAGDGSQGSNHFTLEDAHKLTLVNADENVMQRHMTSSCHANDVASNRTKDVCPLPSLDALGFYGESQEQPSPVSVLDLDGPFLCDNNRRLLYSSENFITASSHALSRSPLIGSFSRSLSWEDRPPEVMSPNSLRLSRLFSKADEDQDSLTFIQKLVSSAGMDRKGCVLASPLDSRLLAKLSDYQGEGIKSRERRSKEKLLFDAVNEALIELTWTTELSAYPWGSTCSHRRDCDDSSCNSAADEIWRVIRSWSILDRYPPGEVIERNLLLDMILKKELVETASADTTRLETFEINSMVCAVVLEDLLEEALVDLI